MRGLWAFFIYPKIDARNGPYAKLYKDVRVYARSGVDTLIAIKEYLNHRAKHLAKTSQRVKDFGVFDFNYVPERH